MSAHARTLSAELLTARYTTELKEQNLPFTSPPVPIANRISRNTAMSLVTYHPVVSPRSYLCYFNSAYNGVYQYISETYLRPRSFITASQPHINNVESNPLMTKALNLGLSTNTPGVESIISYGIYPSHETFDLPKSNLCLDAFTNQSATNSVLLVNSCMSQERPKSSEIWRPFTPPPTKDFNVRCDDDRSVLAVVPSRMKIEHSKTSLFKPVKKKDFRCSHCSSSYTSSAQLISHLRVHTGAKPFSCEHPNCPKTFARNEELTRHRRIHSGVKPHLCDACGKSFGRKDHLSKHAKTHLHASEKRAYVCGVPGCGHRYTRSDALTRHKTSAHATSRRKDEQRRSV